MIPHNTVVHVDESEVIKPYGKKFEALGKVRDGSSPDHKIEKGYHVTEITALTQGNKQPVSLFSHIHSSREENFERQGRGRRHGDRGRVRGRLSWKRITKKDKTNKPYSTIELKMALHNSMIYSTVIV